MLQMLLLLKFHLLYIMSLLKWNFLMYNFLVYYQSVQCINCEMAAELQSVGIGNYRL